MFTTTTTILMLINAASATTASTCTGILRDIDQHVARYGEQSEWLILSSPRGLAYQKKCDGQSTYDSHFCTVVCELAEGDQCQPDESMGDDVCGTGLICGSDATCTPIIDDYEDIFEILSFFDF